VTPQTWLYVVGLVLTLVIALFAAAWKLSTDISSVATKVDLLLTNHLPHIEAELIRVWKRLDGGKSE
jgi:hypothetical protein